MVRSIRRPRIDREVVDDAAGSLRSARFPGGINSSGSVATNLAKFPTVEGRRMLERYHVQRLSVINERWAADLAAVGKPIPVVQVSSAGKRADAARELPLRWPPLEIAAAKSAAEFPMIRALSPRRADLEQNSDEQTWAKIGALYPEEGQLDQASLRLVTSKMPARDSVRKRAGRIARSKGRFQPATLDQPGHGAK